MLGVRSRALAPELEVARSGWRYGQTESSQSSQVEFSVMGWGRLRLESELALMRVRHGDTTAIEVKRASGGLPRSIDRTLCAFANMPAGGTIILGVDERSGFSVVGVEDAAALARGVTDCNRSRVNPAPHLTFETVDVDGVQVLVVEVSPLSVADRPARVGGIAYLRQADGEYPMQSHELRMLDVDRLHVYDRPAYDERGVSGTGQVDLDPGLVRMFCARVRDRLPRLRARTDDEILRLFSVLNADGQTTVAGLTAMGDFPQGRIPALTVTAAVRVTGQHGERLLRDKRDFVGPIPAILSDVMRWAEDAVPLVHAYDDHGNMYERPELPLSAVRELVANALVHRDLGPDTLETGLSVEIRLDHRQLYVHSPGGLKGVSVSQLDNEAQHSQAAVNQRLYQMCKFIDTEDGASVIEGEGGGLIEVRRAARQWGLDLPTFDDSGVAVTAHLWRMAERGAVATGMSQAINAAGPRPHGAGISESSTTGRRSTLRKRPSRNEPAVVAALDNGALTLSEIAKQTGLADYQVRYALSTAIERGIVSMDGHQGNRHTRYARSDDETVRAD